MFFLTGFCFPRGGKIYTHLLAARRNTHVERERVAEDAEHVLGSAV